MTLNNRVNKSDSKVKKLMLLRNLWLALYALAFITVFVAGSMVASKSPRRAETVSIDLAIVNQNAQKTDVAPTVKDSVLLASATIAPETTTTTKTTTESTTDVVDSQAKVDQSVANKPIASMHASVVKPLVITIKPKDSLGKIFKRAGLDAKGAAGILALAKAKPLKNLRAGNKINLLIDSSVKSGIKELAYTVDDLNSLVVTASAGNGWQVRTTTIKPVITSKYISATVKGSIYAAGSKAGISKKLMARFVSIFSSKGVGKIQAGDKFAICYEERTANGKKIGESDIVAAELMRGDKVHRLIGFAGHDGKIDFYTPQGQSIKPSFVRYPLKFDRIGSRFSSARVHPILHIIRPHTGVDLVASTGTPVKSTSNGKIEFMGYKGGYGRTVIVRNGAYSTLYAHLSSFPKDLHSGSYVKQGRVIGFVGSSGWATAPHLHYEFRRDGIHLDPLKVKLPDGEMIAPEYRSRFQALSRKMVAQLDSYNKQRRIYALDVKAESQYK